jgi:hypothetical protein
VCVCARARVRLCVCVWVCVWGEWGIGCVWVRESVLMYICVVVFEQRAAGCLQCSTPF